MENKYSILKKHYGYETFREGQETLIDAVLQERDVVGIMPTGAGKSICFQVPALLMEGVTLVVSPLISLMKDQVNTLIQSGVAAAYINSALSYRQMLKALENARYGKYKIIYVAPERLLTKEFQDFAAVTTISMVAVDEAHCVSQWGQDFRPSYLKIPEFIDTLKKRPVLCAFTATATALVREDIIQLLKLQEPKVVTTGFDRKNLYFEVSRPRDKYSALTSYLNAFQGKIGIVYCSTRKAVEEVCQRLCQNGFSATRYHAGLEQTERIRNQDDFIYDRKQIMVATNAFGMGIDKSNVSFVIHYNMPKNMESYYQEAGRAGRDGEDARCILLYSGQDVRTNLFLIENSEENEELTEEEQELVREKERERLKMMTFYCTTNECLRAYILRYFGENKESYCGNCSNCRNNFEQLDITVEAAKILSCVKRMGERYGVMMVLQVLKGSKNQRVLQLGLDRLSTYGILKEVSEKRLRSIINHLVYEGYLQSNEGEYPVLQLTEQADEILYGGKHIEMKLVKEVKPVEKESDTTNPVLLERLKSLRLKIAKSQSVPAFVIFTDATLRDMCVKLPTTAAQLLRVSGVGSAKQQKYGERFLKVIQDFIEESQES